MKLGVELNYRQLSAEFVVIVVGVAVALAADSWRQDLEDRRIESEYQQRLLTDLETGLDQLQGQFNGQTNASNGAKKLIEFLSYDIQEAPDNEIVNNFILASKQGFNPSSLSHRDTYDELISTGRLNIIQDREFLSKIAEYYRGVSDIALIREGHPTYMLELFGRLTGYPPYNPINDYTSLTQDQRERLVSEVRNNTQLIYELRFALSRLDLLLERGRISSAIALNQELQEML